MSIKTTAVLNPLSKLKYKFADIKIILKIFHSIQEYKSKGETIVTLGTFDGVHIGHRKIISKLTQTAADENCESLILTFSQHPRMVLNDASGIELLSTSEEKQYLLSKTGLDCLVIHPFDKEFSNLSPDAFVKHILVDTFKIRKIIIGHDHRFGKGRAADIDDLVAFGKQFGFNVQQIDAEEVGEVSVSSTRIREALAEGNMSLANQYLGYEYFITGTVSEGKQLGRTIGFPTANIKILEDSKLIPKQGVYVVKSSIGGHTVFGMMNIGLNPTVGGKSLSIEVHFFNFDSDLYNKKIRISMLTRLRDEARFNSIEALTEQLAKDKIASLGYLSAHS